MIENKKKESDKKEKIKHFYFFFFKTFEKVLTKLNSE